MTACVLLSLGVACSPKVDSVEVSPKKASLRSEGDSAAFKAIAKDKDGNEIEEAQVVTWKSSDPAVASVDSTGRVKGVGSGSATITASIVDKNAFADVDVLFVKGVKFDSQVFVVKAGSVPMPLRVTYLNEKGETIDPKNLKVEWSVADPVVAAVNADGSLTGLAAGATRVFAQVEGLPRAEAVVNVNPGDGAQPADAGPGAPDAGAAAVADAGAPAAGDAGTP